MIEYFKNNSQVYVLYLIWIIAGAIGGTPLAIVVVPISVLLLKRREMMLELFLGLIFTLVLSDSRQSQFEWAATVKIVYMLLMGLFLLDKNYFSPHNRFVLAFVPFFAIAYFCVLFAPSYVSAIQKATSYLLLLLVVPNFVTSLIREDKERFLRGIVLLIAMILLLGLALKVVLPAWVSLEGRYSGILGNPNGMGLFCLMAVMVFKIIADLEMKLFSRFEVYAFYGILFLTVVLTGSRSTLFAIGLFFMFTFFNKISPIISTIMLVVAIVGYELVFNNLPAIVMYLGLEEYFRLDTLETASGRYIAWNFAWQNIQDHFYIGRGFSFTEYLYKKNFYELSLLGHQGNAHSSYLTFWLDVGLVGLVCYIIALVSKFLQAAKNSKLALPMLYAVGFSAYFESWLTASLNPFTITMLIGLVILLEIPNIEKEDDKESTVPVH